MIHEGDAAPAFSLPDAEEKLHKLVDFQGKKVILYFYPKDDTPGCTVEACHFRDTHALFEKKNVIVIGISADSSSSHKKFTAKYDLSFILLSDSAKETIQKYGVWGKKKMYGREYEGILRTTFLINEKGIIQKIFPNVDVKTHAEELLALV